MHIKQCMMCVVIFISFIIIFVIINIYIYIYIHICTCIYTYVYIYIYIHMFICLKSRPVLCGESIYPSIYRSIYLSIYLSISAAAAGPPRCPTSTSPRRASYRCARSRINMCRWSFVVSCLVLCVDCG